MEVWLRELSQWLGSSNVWCVVVLYKTCHLSTRVLYCNSACATKDVLISVTRHAFVWTKGVYNANEERESCLGANRGPETFIVISLLSCIQTKVSQTLDVIRCSSINKMPHHMCSPALLTFGRDFRSGGCGGYSSCELKSPPCLSQQSLLKTQYYLRYHVEEVLE